MNVSLFEVVFNDKDTQRDLPTYGIQINDIVFDDLSFDKDVAKGLVKLISKAFKKGNKKEYKLFYEILGMVVNSYEEQLKNL